MAETIFSKIIHKEIPATVVYEDEQAMAFLDATPVHPGHTLVIPKEASRNLLEISGESWGAVTEAVRKLAPAIMKATGASGINILMNNGQVAGQVVFHTHIHLIPRFEGDGLELWHGTPYKTPEESKEIGEKIIEALK